MDRRLDQLVQDGISRRTFARRLSAAAIGAMLASGCRDVGSNAIHLRFWNGFTGPDGFTMLNIVKAFNASQDKIQVTMQRTEWGTYYNKLFVAGLGGRAPEVYVVQVDSLERFIWGGLCHPLNAVFEGPNAVDEADIDANILAAARRGKTTYAFPLDVHPMGVYYNKKLFAEAGIQRPPTNREEFIDAATRMKKTRDGFNQWGFVWEWLRVNLYSVLRQWDAKILSDDYKTVLLDSPEAEEALSWAASLILDLKIASPLENTAALIGLRQGRVGMMWGGPFLVQEVLKQKDLDWGASVVPVVGKKQATWAGSHQMCLRHNITEREHDAAITFMKYLSDNSLDWADGGQVPVRRSLRDTDRFRAMMMQSTFAQQIPYVQYMPSTPFTFEYQVEFDTCCESVLRGSKTPKEALGIAAKKIRAAIARFDENKGRGGAT